ncbi:MAG: hypothetical protein JSR57_12110 [Verrucomicrobia bacterium]|nr:hypothetical protein [Verrucomicrobiota bacterium]
MKFPISLNAFIGQEFFRVGFPIFYKAQVVMNNKSFPKSLAAIEGTAFFSFILRAVKPGYLWPGCKARH